MKKVTSGIQDFLSPRQRRVVCMIPALTAGLVAVSCSSSADTSELTSDTVSRFTLQTFRGEPLHQVRAIAVRADAHVFALTSAPPFVFEFTAAGEPVPRPAIPRGSGPGDLANPWQLLRNPTGDTVFVVDVGNRKLLPITDSLHHATAIPLRLPLQGMIRGSIRQVAFGDPLRLAWIDGKLVMAEYPGGISEQSDFAAGRLQMQSLNSDTPVHLLDFRTLASDAGRTLSGVRQSLTAIPLWTACGDGRVIVFDPYGRRLVIATSRDEMRQGISMPDPLRRLTREHMALFIREQIRRETNGRVPAAQLERAVDAAMNAVAMQFPDMAPDAVELFCDASGRAWLQRFVLESHPLGYGTDWLVSDTSLQTFIRVRFPDRFQPYAFERDGVLGVYRDADDLEYVARATGLDYQNPP